MPQESSQVYSLSEIAQIIGADEKQLHHLAHKGLIDPALSNDPAARFSAVDCARLKIIKRADELGYAPDNILNLIGKPAEVLNTRDPAASCEKFAMDRYKQIYDELNHCELLEQINKQCDLKLLKSYIKNLKALRRAESPQATPPKAAPPSKPRPAEAKVRSTPAPTGKPSKPSPRVQRYSVEKLWDYFNNVEQKEKGASSGPGHSEATPQDMPPPDGDGDLDDWEPTKPGASIFTDAQRYLDSEYWLARTEGLRETLGRQDLMAWTAVGFLIAIIAVTGYFLLSGHKRQAPQESAVALNSKPQSPADAMAPGKGKTSESTPSRPSPGIADDQPAAAQKPTAEQQSTGQPKEAGSLYSPDSIKGPSKSATADKSAAPIKGGETDSSARPSTSAATPLKPLKAPAQSEARPMASEAPVEPLNKPAAPPAVQSTVPNAPAPVQIKDLRIWHDNLNSYYRADFTILKNKAVAEDELVEGYVFVYLLTRDGATGDKGLLLPSGELLTGMPEQFNQGARFSIRHLKEMRVAAPSTMPPGDVTSGKILVYSGAGDLMLDQPFNIPVQPFFSTAEERYDAAAERLNEAAPPTPDTAAVSRPEPTATPDQPAADLQATATTSQTDKTASQSSDDAATRSGAVKPKPVTPQATSIASQDRTPPQPTPKKSTPADKPSAPADIKKTDNPEAAVWEQKSYDAATQGDFDRAISDATQAIKLDPGRVNPYVNRAWAYIEKNKLDNAIQDCKIALSLDPQNALAYNNRGLAYQLRNDARRARRDYRKACDLGLQLGCQNLETIDSQKRIAELIDQSKRAFRDKDWDSVVRATTEVIRLDPENAVAYTNRSAAYAQKSYLRKALKDSNEAIRYNPEFGLAYNNRGYVFELLGSNQKAGADYLKSCSLGLDLGCKNFERLNGH